MAYATQEPHKSLKPSGLLDGLQFSVLVLLGMTIGGCFATPVALHHAEGIGLLDHSRPEPLPLVVTGFYIILTSLLGTWDSLGLLGVWAREHGGRPLRMVVQVLGIVLATSMTLPLALIFVYAAMYWRGRSLEDQVNGVFRHAIDDLPWHAAERYAHIQPMEFSPVVVPGMCLGGFLSFSIAGSAMREAPFSGGLMTWAWLLVAVTFCGCGLVRHYAAAKQQRRSNTFARGLMVVVIGGMSCLLFVAEASGEGNAVALLTLVAYVVAAVLTGSWTALGLWGPVMARTLGPFGLIVVQIGGIVLATLTAFAFAFAVSIALLFQLPRWAWFIVKRQLRPGDAAEKEDTGHGRPKRQDEEATR